MVTYQLKEYIGSFLEMSMFVRQMSDSAGRQIPNILLVRVCLKTEGVLRCVCARCGFLMLQNGEDDK